MAYVLADLAVRRARLQHAISTARQCGDFTYCRENRPRLDLLDAKIDSLKRVMNPHVVNEAREITNADI